MYISTADWVAFTKKLSALDKKAAQAVAEWVQKNGFADTTALIDFCYGIATKYGEGTAALSAEMYDVVAELSGKFTEAAQVAETATYQTTAASINGVLSESHNLEKIGAAIGRLVKKAGADTMLQNAKRDKAQFAWIPYGDTCAYCIALASRGWQDADKTNGSAEHIHGNCDCMYSIRFTPEGGVRGYDPDRYKRIYYGANLDGQAPTANNRLNAIRRESYAKSKEKINAQKRAAYQKRKELNSSQAEEMDV